MLSPPPPPLPSPNLINFAQIAEGGGGKELLKLGFFRRKKRGRGGGMKERGRKGGWWIRANSEVVATAAVAIYPFPLPFLGERIWSPNGGARGTDGRSA